VKALEPHDRPREKLARAGAGALGDNELVAVVLGSGTASRDALAVAQDVLNVVGGVSGLPQMGLDDLLQVSGIGRPRAARLLAAVELGRRAVTHQRSARPQLRTPRELGTYLLPLYGGHREERFGIIMFDAKYHVIRSEIISVGTVDASFAHPRHIFRPAVVASAFSLAIFHNHPSGDPTPSRDDVELTGNLVAAGELMSIPIVDHVILGAGRFYSFREQGMLR
jgi:DNA repair protein RadC